MRKHFLLLFLMAILPLAGWADNPNPYKFTMSQDIITSTTLVSDAPTVASVTKGETALTISGQGAVYDLNRKVVGSFETSGYYYRMVYFKDGSDKKAAYVPFYVAGRVPTQIRINDKVGFDNDMANYGAYWYYYGQAGFGWCDVWYYHGTEERVIADEVESDGTLLYPGDQPLFDAPWRDTENELPEGYSDQDAEAWYSTLTQTFDPGQTNFEITHSWYATQTSNPDNYAISFYNAGVESWKLAVKYGADSEPWFAWGEDKIFGVNEDQKAWGLIQVDEIKDHFAVTGAFAADQVKWVLVPQNAPDTLVAATMALDENTIVEYTEKYHYLENTVQKPIFTAAGTTAPDAWVYLASGSKDEALVEGQDYEIRWTDGEDAKYIMPGKKNFKVVGIGIYGYYEVEGQDKVYDSKELPKTYRIIGEKVIINPAYTYKTYGQADPIRPNYEFEGQLVGDDNLADAIEPFLKLVRREGQTGEAVGDYEYSIGLTDNYATDCTYEISIQGGYSLLKIQKANVQVNVKNYWKEYNTSDPTFEFEVAQGSELQNNETPATSGITITRTGHKVSDTETILNNVNADAVVDGDGKIIGATKKADTYTYAFKAESKNYNVTFGNEFLIIPTTATGGVQVAFTEQEHVYNGKYQTPEFTVTDNNGEVVLVEDQDFVIDSWEKNKNVGTAKVKIHLIGNYVATGAASKKEGTFTITKAPLTITPKSYDAEQDTYELIYTGFVCGGENPETADSLYSLNTQNPDTIFFSNPAAITVEKGASVEQDVYELVINPQNVQAYNYEITYGKGLLALNGKTLIYAWPEEKTVTYGDDPAELTIGAMFAADYENEYVNNPEALAALKISGIPVYTLTREDATNKNVGKYDINVAGPTVLKDYTVNYVTELGTDAYEIQYKDLTLTADDKEKDYREAVPTLTAKVSEMAYNEKPEDIGLVHGGNGGYNVTLLSSEGWNWTNSAWTNNNEHVGTYTIRAAFRNNHSNIYGNYRVILANGTLTVKKAAVTVTADDKTKQFGAADPEFTCTIKDKNGNVVSTTIANELSEYITLTRPDAGTEDGENYGDHAIVAAAPVEGEGQDAQTLTPANFTITFVNGKLTINKAEMLLTANDQWINYYGNINPYDVTITVPNGEGYKTYKWNKKGKDDLTEEQAKENEFIKSILKGLTVADGKQNIGANADAYEYELNEGVNYVVAAENGFTNGYLTVYPLDMIPLDKEELAKITNAPLKQVLEDHKGLTVDVYLPARKMDKDEWYAWVLPFKVKQRDFFKEGVWGYGVMETLNEAKTTAKTVNFGVEVQPIAANTPFIVKVDDDITAAKMKTMKFNVEIGDLNYEENPSAGSANTVQFIGLYQERDEDESFDESVRVLRRGSDGHMAWYKATDLAGNAIVRTNAYLQFPSPEAANGARIFVEDPNGGTTDITGVVTVNNAGVQGWYNMNGVKMQNAPVEKGVYIKDGKKVVIK